MKIVYYDNGQLDMAFLASLIHIGELSPEERLSFKRIITFKKNHFRHRPDGILHFWGNDATGNEVYLLRLPVVPLGLKAIYTVLNNYANPMEWRFFDTTPVLNAWYLNLGRFKIKSLNGLLLTVAVKEQFPELVKIVAKVKERISYGQT